MSSELNCPESRLAVQHQRPKTVGGKKVSGMKQVGEALVVSSNGETRASCELDRRAERPALNVAR